MGPLRKSSMTPSRFHTKTTNILETIFALFICAGKSSTKTFLTSTGPLNSDSFLLKETSRLGDLLSAMKGTTQHRIVPDYDARVYNLLKMTRQPMNNAVLVILIRLSDLVIGGIIRGSAHHSFPR